MSTHTFPDGFLWGAATAGHQIEGNNTTSDTWFLEHVTPSVFREPSGMACDSYNRWLEDLEIVKSLGLNTYRFSIEWARIEPTKGEYNADALAHYSAILDQCKAMGLTTVVTLSHFTAPHWFASESGWLHPASAEWFADYCGHVIESLGDRIDYALTFNEPNLGRLLNWVLPPFVHEIERATLEAASKAAGVAKYRCGNVVLEEDYDAMQAGQTTAHLAAKAAIKKLRPTLPVGLSLALVDDIVVGDDPADAVVRDRKRAECYDYWLELASHDDFLGIQNYEQTAYDRNGKVSSDGKTDELYGGVAPESLAGVLRYAHGLAGVPLMVTEHGMSTADDAKRAAFIAPSLVGLREVLTEGIEVLGYIHWSLLDNFEWIFGYEPQLGLVSVDRQTFARTPKPSASVLRAIAMAKAVSIS
jgi:beta-glucosidase